MFYHPMEILAEKPEKSELRWPQFRRLASDLHLMGQKIHAQRPIDIGGRDFFLRRCTTKEGAYASKEGPPGNGFNQVLVCPQPEASDKVLFSLQSR